MRHTWSGLGLLLVVPWLAGCVSGPQVRLDTGKKPDYKINGEYYDCLAPSTPNARNIKDGKLVLLFP
jgi:hypothetical protein